jgi:hypothetical protein
VIAATFLDVRQAFGSRFAKEIAAKAYQASIRIFETACVRLTTGPLHGEIDAECQIAEHAAALGFEARAGAAAVAADLALSAFCVAGAAPGLPANAVAAVV